MGDLVSERRFLGRTIIWYSLSTLAVLILLFSIPSYLDQLGKLTYSEQVRYSVADPGYIQAGPTEYWLDLASMVVQLAASAACIGLAMLIFNHRRRVRDRVALLVSLFLLIFGTAMTGPLQTLTEGSLIWFPIVGRVEAVLFAGWAVLFYLFPDGQFFPAWTRVAALTFVPWAAITLLFRDKLSPLTRPEAGQIILLFVWYMVWPVSMLVAQVMRFKQHSTLLERQQTKWVIWGFLILFGTLFCLLPLLLIQFAIHSSQDSMASITLFSRGYGLVWSILVSLLPLCMGVAVLRYRLWDIDFILNRTLVYGLLSAFVIGVYILVVGLLGELLHPRGELHQPFDFALSLFATAGIAVLFQPAREQLQRLVNRWMYGERDDPHTVLARLSRRLEAAMAPEMILPMVVETIAQALMLPYAAILLWQDRVYRIAAEYGRRAHPGDEGKEEAGKLPYPKGYLYLPLVFQSEELGRLVLAPRTAGEAFTPADVRFLEEVAGQAGAVVYTVKLTADLQRSRERLVTTREEERRRLRRDLHDGLGSALASLSFNLDAARNLLSQDPATTDKLLVELKAQTQAAIADIRRLINDLRPPALDELGLLPAIQQYVDYVNRPAGLSISIQIPGDLPALPAAVEVAVYRIVLEALTNIIRHANAKHCTICISLSDPFGLTIEIVDDGQGMSELQQPGIGISTMRERSEELGGTFLVENGPSSGTRVAVKLPLLKPVW